MMKCYVYKNSYGDILLKKERIVPQYQQQTIPSFIGCTESPEETFELLKDVMRPFKRTVFTDNVNEDKENETEKDLDVRYYSYSSMTRLIYNFFPVSEKPIYICMLATRKGYDEFLLVHYAIDDDTLKHIHHLDFTLCPSEKYKDIILDEVCETLEEPDLHTLEFLCRHEFEDKIVYFYTCEEDDAEKSESWNDTVYFADGKWLGYVDVHKATFTDEYRKIIDIVKENCKNGKISKW